MKVITLLMMTLCGFALCPVEGSAQASIEQKACVLPYTVDYAQSAIKFKAISTLHPIDGRVERFKGEFCAVSDKPALNLSGDVYVDIASLKTGNSGMDRNMYKMFDVDRYPQAHCRIDSFVLSSFEKGELKGTLTIRDRSVSFKKQVSAVKTDSGVKVAGAVDVGLEAFGLKAPTFLFLKVKDNVTVEFTVVVTPGRK